jgi:hypothetical protein
MTLFYSSNRQGGNHGVKWIRPEGCLSNIGPVRKFRINSRILGRNEFSERMKSTASLAVKKLLSNVANLCQEV